MYYLVTVYDEPQYSHPNTVGKPCVLRTNERSGEVVALTRFPKLYWREDKVHSTFHGKTHSPRSWCRLELISASEYKTWEAMKLAPFASLIHSTCPKTNMQSINLVFTDEKIKREW